MKKIYLHTKIKYFNDPEVYIFDSLAIEDTPANHTLLTNSIHKFKNAVMANDYNRPQNYELYAGNIVSLKEIKYTEIFLKEKKVVDILR